MRLEQHIDQGKWNAFVVQHSSPSSFSQSWQWGEFQKSLGNNVYRLALSDDHGHIALCQIIVRHLYFGATYLYVPRGPVVKDAAHVGEILKLFTMRLQSIAKKERAILIRFVPPFEQSVDFSSLGFKTPKVLLTQKEPEYTMLMDLTKSEDELVQNMHRKTRYNIKLGQRKGVEVFDKTFDDNAFRRFLTLAEETSKRHSVRFWPRARFEKFREQFFIRPTADPADPYAILLVGEWQGMILAGAIVLFFGDSGTRLYSCSSEKHTENKIPNLVIWESIKQAKKRNKRWLDMWGIAPRGAGKDNPWFGFTAMKLGYGTPGLTSREVHYAGAWDLVLNKPAYHLLKLGKFVKGIMR